MEIEYKTDEGLHFILRGAESLPPHNAFKNSEELFLFLANAVNRHCADIRYYEAKNKTLEAIKQVSYLDIFDFISSIKAGLRTWNPSFFKAAYDEKTIIIEIPSYKSTIEIQNKTNKINGKKFKYLDFKTAIKILQTMEARK